MVKSPGKSGSGGRPGGNLLGVSSKRLVRPTFELRGGAHCRIAWWDRPPRFSAPAANAAHHRFRQVDGDVQLVNVLQPHDGLFGQHSSKFSTSRWAMRPRKGAVITVYSRSFLAWDRAAVALRNSASMRSKSSREILPSATSSRGPA